MVNDLSIIIISYNTSSITIKCLDALVASLQQQKMRFEIIVIDNASEDSSVKLLKEYKTTLDKSAKNKNISYKLICNMQNVGYGKANNEGVAASDGKYILFLNSDVLIKNVNWKSLIDYMKKNRSVGALTVKVMLKSGGIDPASHRGFPTISRSIFYFLKLERFTDFIPSLSSIFGGYHLRHLDLGTIHEIDSPSGAFYLTRKSVLDKIGSFDASFFMYGEDLDLSYRIKQNGYKIIYNPEHEVTHLKYASGLQNIAPQHRTETKKHYYNAMKIFYDKHFSPKNLKPVNKLMHFFIDLKQRFS